MKTAFILLLTKIVLQVLCEKNIWYCRSYLSRRFADIGIIIKPIFEQDN